MTTIEIQPAFDPAFQPIGYALAAELLTLTPSPPDLPVGPDLFGWELAAAAHPTTSTAVDPDNGSSGSPRRSTPTGAARQLPTA